MDVSGVTDGTADVQDPFQPLRDRGVSEAVWQARGYLPYYGRRHPLWDPEIIRDALAPYGLTAGQIAANARLVNAAVDADGRKGYGDGLIMPKFAALGEPVLPQLRPRYPVSTGGVTRHRHDRHFADSKSLTRHIEDKTEGHGGDWDDVAPDAWHTHDNFAKYLLQSKAKQDFWHDHATDSLFGEQKGRAKLRQHIRAHHRGKRVDPMVRHKHRRDRPGQHVADRLDLHPWAADRLLEAERVYFVIEGTPKGDAVLSKIIATNANASVFDVPSVTLWQAPELERFATVFLRPPISERKLVVVVPDADWFENPAVLRQALLCREFLRGCGVAACIAAPPQSSGCKGIDDFLVGGGELDDLDVLDREAPFSLALHAAADGTIKGTITGLARVLGVRKNAERVVDALQNHIAQGLITADRDLKLGVNEWTGGIGWTGAIDERPTFTVAPSCRYEEQFVRLGDYEPAAEPTCIDDVFMEEIEAQTGHGMFPDVAAAIQTAAERMGLRPGTVRDRDFTRGFREARDETRELLVRLCLAEGMSIDATAARLDISDKQVRRIVDGPRGRLTEELARTEERDMLPPTDAELADDVALLAEIASRLQRRFPRQEAVSEAVERFLKSVSGTKSDGGAVGR